MSADENKAIVLRFFEEFLKTRNLAAAERFVPLTTSFTFPVVPDL
jgi:hypothetical protein